MKTHLKFRWVFYFKIFIIMSILIVTEKQKNFLLENINSKQKAEDLLTSHIKKTYPFITKIQLKKPNISPTIVDADIDIDLNLFYKITHTTPPKVYYEKKFLMDILEDKSVYLLGYVDEEYRDKIKGFNDKLEEKMNRFYSILPPTMTYTKFDDTDIEEYWSNITNNRVSLEFIQDWANQKEPRNIAIHYFYPKVNLEELNSLI